MWGLSERSLRVLSRPCDYDSFFIFGALRAENLPFGYLVNVNITVTLLGRLVGPVTIFDIAAGNSRAASSNQAPS